MIEQRRYVPEFVGFSGSARVAMPTVVARSNPAYAVGMLAPVLVVAVFLPQAFGLVPFGFRLTPARMVLLAYTPFMLFSFASLWVSNRYRFALSDVFMPFAWAWMVIALSQTEGLDQALKSGGVSGLELAGSYLTMRCLMRNTAEIHASVRVFCIAAAVTGVLGLADTIAGFHILHDDLALLTGYDYFQELAVDAIDTARLGLFRSQSVFEHPILFGVIMCYALMLSVDLRGRTRTLCRAGCLLGLFLSLSSAPWLALFLGIGLTAYVRFAPYPRPWLVLIIAGLLGTAAISLLVSEPFGWIFSHLVLDARTSWYRLLIWQYGGFDVLQSPLVGIGITRDWLRPGWMGASVDSLWLGSAMGYGILGSALIGLGLLGASSLPVKMRRATAGVIGLREIRLSDSLGIITFLTIFLGFTVDYWGSAFVIIGLLAGMRAALGQISAY